MTRVARHDEIHRRRDDPRRAAVVLLGMLVVAGVLLVSPFVVVAVRLDAASRPPAAVSHAIEHSDCTQLRAQLDSAMEGADSDSDSLIDFSGRRSEVVRRIVERGKRLACRPAIRSPYAPAQR